MALQQRASIGFLWGTAERIAVRGGSFVVAMILARILGPANYGLVILASTIALLGQTLLSETFSEALIQATDIEPQHASSVFWLLTGAGLLATVALLAGADLLAIPFGEPDLAPLLRALSPLLLLAGLQAVPMALFKRDIDFRSLAATATGGTVVGGIVGIGLAFAGAGPWSLIASMLAQAVVATAALWHRSRFRPEWSFSHTHLAELWSYGQFTFLLRLAAFVSNQSPRLLVGYLFGPEALGIFSLGLRITETLTELVGLPAANVALPVIARLRHDPVLLKKTIISATQLSAMVAIPPFLCLAVTAPFAVPLLFGPKWIAAIPMVQALSLLGIVAANALVSINILRGLGRPAVTLGVTVSGAVVTLVVFLLAAPFGFAATVIAYVIRGYSIVVSMPFVIQRLTGIDAGSQYRALAPVLLAGGVTALAAEATVIGLQGALAPIVLLAAVIVVGGVCYAAALRIFAPRAMNLGLSILAQLRPGRGAAS
jgi:PST family polysaccharide transporter